MSKKTQIFFIIRMKTIFYCSYYFDESRTEVFVKLNSNLISVYDSNERTCTTITTFLACVELSNFSRLPFTLFLEI